MVVAVLVASITYQAGLNPPGGFWQEDMATFPNAGDDATYIRGIGHFAGDPVLRDKNFNRYAAFMVFNTAAFVQSLCVIVVLMTESSFNGKLRLYLLRVFVIVHVTSLGVAYCVGSTRDSYDIYFSGIVMLILIIFVSVIGIGVHYHYKNKMVSKEKRASRSTSALSQTTDDSIDADDDIL